MHSLESAPGWCVGADWAVALTDGPAVSEGDRQQCMPLLTEAFRSLGGANASSTNRCFQLNGCVRTYPCYKSGSTHFPLMY